MSNILLLAVDIEKCGSNLIAHPVISVGFCLADAKGVVLEKKKINFEVNWWECNEEGVVTTYGDFEERCCVEFWSKQPSNIIEACKCNPAPLPVAKAWAEVRSYIDHLEVRFPGHKIKFLSDNASFDVATIDYGLELYTGRVPMRYTTTGNYRSVVAADDMFDMLPKDVQKQAMKEIDGVVQHDHDPVNDAHHILLQFVKAVEYRQTLIQTNH